jgi:hypothetical protein
MQHADSAWSDQRQIVHVQRHSAVVPESNAGPWVDGQDGIPNPLRGFPPVCLRAAVTPCGASMWLIVKVGAYDIPAVLIPAMPHKEDQ